MSSSPHPLRSPSHVVSVSALASFLLLAAIQLGVVPAMRFQWAFNFWAYLPPAIAGSFGLAALALCSDRVRRGIASALSSLGDTVRRAPAGALDAVVFVAASLFLWIFREPRIYGDAYLLVSNGRKDWSFVFPDVGASYLLHGAFLMSKALGVKYFVVLQAWGFALGGVTALLLLRLGRLLGAGRSAAAIAALVGSGGLLRVFAGHVEVYAFVVPAVAAYLLAALAFLQGRCARWVPCLALGVAVWVHMSCLFLVPSLALLSRLRAPELTLAAWLRRAAADVALAATPSLAFLLFLLLAGQADALLREIPKMLEILGQSSSEGAKRWWVRGWGGRGSVGTDVVFLSAAHSKYLLNAGFLLAPASLPVVLGFALRRPSALVADPAVTLLLAAAAPLVVYSSILRPFWGPFDWDLFSITSLCLAALAARLLAKELSAETFRGVAVWLVGFQLLFVGLPFLAINAVDARHAGPFATPGMFDARIIEPFSEPSELLAPWL